MNIVISIVVGLLLLGLIIVFHELGHFIMCKMNNVAVPSFFVGFGPKLFSFKAGETEFSIRLFPIGGACQMVGLENPEADNERSITNKPPLVKLAIFFAGPFFNFILAFIVSLVVIGLVGYDPCVVTSVEQDSAAYEAGLRPGDIITSFDGSSIHLGRELSVDLMYDPLDDTPVSFTYERDGEEFTSVLSPRLLKRLRLGFTYSSTTGPAEILEIVGDGAFAAAGIQKGDIIESINEEQIQSGESLREYLEANPLDGSMITVGIRRGGALIEYKVVPGFLESYEAGFNFNSNVRYDTEGFDVIKYSFYELKYNIVGTFKSLVMLFTGKLSKDDVGGPVRIVEELGNTIEATESQGTFIVVMNLINWIIILSANLGVMNLLPLPALDGGRILFGIIELIRRKPIPPEKEGLVHVIGIVLLLILTVFIFFNDIMRLFT